VSWKIYKAELSYQKDRGTEFAVYETTRANLVLEWIGDEIFCLVNRVLWDWVWSLRWGPEDEYGIADRSVGALLWRFSQWAAEGFGAYRKRRDLTRFPVTFEFVRDKLPDVGWPWDGSDPEDYDEETAT
jgi:hypothetical protein